MSTLTKNLKLIKPELTDAADITAYNENWDKLDEHSHDIDSLIGVQSQITCGTAEPVGGVDGDVYIQIIEE